MTSPGRAALVARRYFERYGADSRALAAVPVAFRKHASMNPDAIMREPFDVDDHQASRFVCEPLHLLDYCLINDGAACVIVTDRGTRARLAQARRSISAECRAAGGARGVHLGVSGLGIAQQSSSITRRSSSPSTKWRI